MSTEVAILRPRRDTKLEEERRSIQPPGPHEAGDGILAFGQLQVRRRDIRWFTLGDRVQVAVTVRNLGDRPSAPTRAALQAATLGAFVRWRPLTTLHVPALAPGESAVLRAEAVRPATRPLGPPDRVPPRRLLTALGAGDDDRAERPDQAPTLPASPFDLLFGPTTYWAGNLNIFIGGQAVERHQAQALRILPGRVNMAMFVVGGRLNEAYRFQLQGLDSRWEAGIFDFRHARPFSRGLRRGDPIELGAWVPVGSRMLALALCPPAGCAEGAVEVHVTQQSTGQSAVVEFSFDPRAAGPGCYVVG